MKNNEAKQALWNIFESLRERGHSIGIDTVALFSAFLFLRWLDRYETELEAVASFEEKEYQPVLPCHIRWDVVKDIPHIEFEKFYTDHLIPSMKQGGHHPHAHSLARFSKVLEYQRPSNGQILKNMVQFIDNLPFNSLKDCQEAGNLLEFIIKKVFDFGKKLSGENMTPDIVAELMVELVDPQPEDRVYDPCFGMGGVLLKCAERMHIRAKEMPPHVWNHVRFKGIFGFEYNPVSYVVGFTRIVLAGIDIPGFELGNTLERVDLSNRSSEQFDCILANPPFGAKVSPEIKSHFPVESRDTLSLFIQHIMSSLKMNGRAVVLVPSGFLFKTGPEKQIRQKLLKNYRVEGVIALPKGSLLPYTGIETNLLIIRNEKPSLNVRFMSLQEFRNYETYGNISGVKKVVKEIVARFRAGQMDSTLWETSIENLGHRDWDLHVSKTGDEELDNLINSILEIDKKTEKCLLVEIADVFAGFSYDKKVTTEHKDEAIYPLIRVADISENSIDLPKLYLNKASLNRLKHQKMETEAGDILVSSSGTIGKIGSVDLDREGMVPAKNMIVIRCKEKISAGYVNALLKSSVYQSWVQGHGRGGVIKHLSIRTLRNLPIPVPEIQIQEKVHKIWKNHGGDSASILLRILSGSDMHPVIEWIESSPEAVEISKANDLKMQTDRLIILERFINGLIPYRNQLVHSQLKDLPDGVESWLISMNNVLLNLQGISEIPVGSAKFSLLESARVSISNILHSLTKPTLPIHDTIVDLSQKIQDLIHAELDHMLIFDGFDIVPEREYIQSGRESEVTFCIKNPKPLALRQLEVSTLPDYGKIKKEYLAENGEFKLSLVFPAQVAQGQLNFTIKYTCNRLDGKKINGEIPYSLKIKSIRESIHEVDIGSSPYNGQKAVERKEMFFGRKDIIERISTHLTKVQPAGVISLEGNRRIGKTSILRMLKGESILTGHSIIYCDLQGVQGEESRGGLSTTEIFRVLTREIGFQLYDQDIETWLQNIPARQGEKPFKKEFMDSLKNAYADDKSLEVFEGYLQTVLKSIKPSRLLIMLDEFDKVQEGIDEGWTSRMVPDNLRYLIQKYNNFSIMIVGSRRLKRLRSQYSSPLFGLGETIIVGPLQYAEAGRLVEEPTKGRLNYVPEAKELVVSLCARRANLIQMMCDRLFYMAKQQGDSIISLTMVEKSAKELTVDNEHFATLWEENCENERQRFILTLLVRMAKASENITFLSIEEALLNNKIPVSDAEEFEKDVECLVEMELIDRFEKGGKDQYRISVPLMQDWLRHVDFEIQCRKAIREGEAK
jgi:type I restriction enzyme M protein